MLRERQDKKSVSSLWRMLNEDNRNGISREELKKGLGAFGYEVGEQDFKEVWDWIDLDQSGEISFDELVKVAEAALPVRGAKGLSLAELLSETKSMLKFEIDEKGTPPSFRLARQTAIETVLKFVAGWSDGS